MQHLEKQEVENINSMRIFTVMINNIIFLAKLEQTKIYTQ